jgi:hypothetical protein
MVDAADLKSASCKGVWVRVPPSAVNRFFRSYETRRCPSNTADSSFSLRITEWEGHGRTTIFFIARGLPIKQSQRWTEGAEDPRK